MGQILRQAARLSPDGIAVVDLGNPGDPRRELTFFQLERMARRVAAQLSAAGVLAGDRVAVLAENRAELAAVWFGVVYLGAAVVPLNVLSTSWEIAERVQHAAAKLIMYDAARAALVQEARVHGELSALGLHELDFEAGAELDYPVDASPADTAMVLYTSGSTGKPKGAAISHASLLLHTALLVQHALALDAASRVLCTLPLSHSYGCRLAMLAPFYARARIVVLPRFDARRSLRALHDEGVTWLPGVPTMFAAWGQAQGNPAPSLRWALCAGAPLGLEIARRAEARLGVEVRQGYGMTEATFATINAPPDARVLGSVGKPVWGVELRVVDEAAGDRACAPGQSGEVLVRGPNVMTNYLFDREASHEIARDGWVRSGDVGYVDEAGRLCIVDRIKDLIIRGGYNVYPSEVESVLGAFSGVSNVAVVGRPDEFHGEEVVAVVVANSPPPLAALHAFAAERLSRAKLPREYAFVAELPLGPSGKVHKRTLREWLAGGRLTTQRVQG